MQYQEGVRGAPRGGPVTPASSEKVDELQQKVGIAFRDPSLLLEALTHSSFANENPLISPRDNERLEYLGDAVLQLISAEYLYKMRPDAKEGEMTQVRSAMVNTNTLAALSEELGIGEFLFLGKGIAKGGGRNLRSLLANAFEAVLGAIFLDAGYDAAYHYCLERFKSMPDVVQDENFKGRLQQVVQERFGVTPYYDAVGARGPGGRMREYTAVVYAGGDPLGTGHGRSKQTAEQLAARDALDKLLGETLATRRSRRARRRGRSDEQGVVAEPDHPVPVESVLTQLEPEPGFPEPEENRTEGRGPSEKGEAAIPSVRFPEPEAPPPRPRRRRSKKPSEANRAGGPGPPDEGAPSPQDGAGHVAEPSPPTAPAELDSGTEPAPAEPEPRPARRSRRKRPAPEPSSAAAEPGPPSGQVTGTPQPETPAPGTTAAGSTSGRQLGEPLPSAEPEPAPPAPKPRRTRRKPPPRPEPAAPDAAEPVNNGLSPPPPPGPPVAEHPGEQPDPAPPSPEQEAPPPQPARSRQFGEPLD